VREGITLTVDIASSAALPRLRVGSRFYLAGILAIALALRLWRLGDTGFITPYYLAGVRSMMLSWHNFFFNAFDPAGFVSLDKPPVAFWIQAASARLLGFDGLSLLLPQAIEGTLAVALLCHLVRRRFGWGAGLAAGLFLALTPISVAVDRSTNTESCLVLVLLLAAWALDTNNDGNVDYVVALVGSTGTVAAGAAAIDHPDQILCTGAATADQSTRTYSAVIPSSCVGSPASFHWGAIMRYDTNPADSNAPVALDLTPDGNSDMAGPVAAPTDPSVSTAGAHDGYWMLTKSGTIFGFGSASNNGVTDQLAFTHIEPTPSGNGYWVLTEGGRIIPKGDAINLPTVGMQPGERAVSLSSTPSGSGLWVFTDKGRVIPLGDAQFFGDMSHTPLNGSILGSVATPTGKGYWMVGSDGGIFSFGDAKFHGSTGNMKLNQPVMAMAPAPDGSGYWLVAADGGIFAFDVPFYGSMGGTPLNKPISSMVPGQGGYMMVAQDGGIFSFGSVAFHGSLGANPPASPVVSVALQP